MVLVVFLESNAVVLFPEFLTSLWHASPLFTTANSLEAAVKFVSSTSVWGLVDTRFCPVASKFTGTSLVGVFSTRAFIAPSWEKFAFIVLFTDLVSANSNWGVKEVAFIAEDWGIFANSFWAASTWWGPFTFLNFASTAGWCFAASWIAFTPSGLAAFSTTDSSGWSFMVDDLLEAFINVASDFIWGFVIVDITFTLLDKVIAVLVDALLLPAAAAQVFVAAFNLVSSTWSGWDNASLELVRFVDHSFSFGLRSAFLTLLVVTFSWEVLVSEWPSSVESDWVVIFIFTSKDDSLLFTSWAAFLTRVKLSLSWPFKFVAFIVTSEWFTLVWSTFTDQFLATAVMFNHDALFFMSTAFSIWAFSISTAVWNAFVFEAAIIDLIAHKMFVETALWNWFAVPVKALDVIGITTRTDPADVAFIVPRFTLDTWTTLVHASSFWGGWWGHWWWSVTANVFDTFVFDAAWRWLWVFTFKNEASWASWFDVLGLVRILALVVVAFAFISWTVAFVLLVFNGNEFVTLFDLTSSFVEFTSRLIAFIWNALKNLFATFVSINKAPNFSKTGLATVWEGWGWASDWATVFSKVVFTETDLTLVSWGSWVLPWGSTWADGVFISPAAVVFNLLVDVDFFSVAVADAFDLLALFGWVLPFRVDWEDLAGVVFTASNAAVFIFSLDRTWASTMILFTEVWTVVFVIPLEVDWNFSLGIPHTAVNAARLSPPSSFTVGFAVFFLAFISWVIPDLVIDVDFGSKSGTITVLVAADDAARIVETWFPLPLSRASRFTDKLVAWISWVVPFRVDWNFNVLWVEAASESWNTLVVQAAWFIIGSGWIFILEFHAIAALFLWTTWEIVAASVVTFAIVSWALAFRISWMWSGLEFFALVDFTGLGVRALVTSLALIFIAAADDLFATFILIDKTISWSSASWAAVREAWIGAGPVNGFDLASGSTFVNFTSISLMVISSVEINLSTVWFDATLDTAFSFVFNATWAVSGGGWLVVDETMASFEGWFWTTWVVITASVITDAFLSAASTLVSWMWSVFKSEALLSITRLSWTVVAFFADLSVAAHSDLFATFVVIDKSFDWASAVLTTVWEAFVGWALNWNVLSFTVTETFDLLAFIGSMGHQLVFSDFFIVDTVPTADKAAVFVPWFKFAVSNAMHVLAGFSWVLVEVVDVNDSAVSVPDTASDLTDFWNFFDLTFRHTFHLNVSFSWIDMWPSSADSDSFDNVAIFIFSFTAVDGAAVSATRTDVAAAIFVLGRTTVTASWASFSETRVFDVFQTFLNVTFASSDHAAIVIWVWNISGNFMSSTTNLADVFIVNSAIVVAARLFRAAVTALISTRTEMAFVFILVPFSIVAPFDTVDI